jgi:hypothetical protein
MWVVGERHSLAVPQTERQKGVPVRKNGVLLEC